MTYPSDSNPIKSKTVEERMKQLQDRADHLRNLNPPWWYSGSACLAALLWLSFVGLLFAVTLGYAEDNTTNDLNTLLLAFLATVISAMAANSR